MGVLLVLLLFTLLLFILSEPLYIAVKKQRGMQLVFHFVFFSLSLTRGQSVSGAPKEENKKSKISPTTYFRVWLKLRKRVKIIIDALYLPLRSSPYAEALLSSLYSPYRRGIALFEQNTDTSFLLHVETTLLDALIFYFKCMHYEKIKNER